MALRCSEEFVRVTQRLRAPYILKASFDKANRSSIHSYHGPGLDEGLNFFEAAKAGVDVPLLTDIHEIHQAASGGADSNWLT